MIFDKEKTKIELEKALSENSEQKLLAVLKENSFLFYDLYSRKRGIQPNFCEVPFGVKYRCDFCWLNDNSDGPEWVLVEIEKPHVKLFKNDGDPTADFNRAIEQVKSWDRYFQQTSSEKNRVFGAVSRFRFVLVVGAKKDWQKPEAAIWRSHHNRTSNIEIRSMDTFKKAIALYKESPDTRSFEEHPISKKAKDLPNYCRDYEYLSHWENILTSNA